MSAIPVTLGLPSSLDIQYEAYPNRPISDHKDSYLKQSNIRLTYQIYDTTCHQQELGNVAKHVNFNDHDTTTNRVNVHPHVLRRWILILLVENSSSQELVSNFD